MLNYFKKTLTRRRRRLQVSNFFSVPLDPYIATGERDAVIASSGMGKSYLTGVLAEETLENGGLLCIIDPEGEYYTMAEYYPIIVVGGDREMVPLDEENIDLYIQTMLETNLSLVFDLSDYVDSQQQELYSLIAESLFLHETEYRRKVRLIVEEAQIYAPQRMPMSKPKGKAIDPVLASQKLAKRGRKRAIDSLWATQRPASLNKDILSQCNRFWFGGITAEQDYKAIRPFLNEAGIEFHQLKALQPGEFYFYSKGETKKIKVRKRLCKHGGATPEDQPNIRPVTNVGLEKALESLAEQIRANRKHKEEEDTEIIQLKRAMKELQDDNARLRDELSQERMATKVIRRIEVEPGSPMGRRRPMSVNTVTDPAAD